MLNLSKLMTILPVKVQNRMDEFLEAASLVREIRDPRVAASLGPAGIKGMLLKRGKQGVPTKFASGHKAHFDWTYPRDFPEMQDLYTRAKRGQWDADTYLDWSTDVDPFNPATPLIPQWFFAFEDAESIGIKLNEREKVEFQHSMASWMLSQFLHGEQGALMAAAQVTEAVQFFDASSTARPRSWTRGATSRCSTATSIPSSRSCTRSTTTCS